MFNNFVDQLGLSFVGIEDFQDHVVTSLRNLYIFRVGFYRKRDGAGILNCSRGGKEIDVEIFLHRGRMQFVEGLKEEMGCWRIFIVIPLRR